MKLKCFFILTLFLLGTGSIAQANTHSQYLLFTSPFDRERRSSFAVKSYFIDETGIFSYILSFENLPGSRKIVYMSHTQENKVWELSGSPSIDYTKEGFFEYNGQLYFIQENRVGSGFGLDVFLFDGNDWIVQSSYYSKTYIDSWEAIPGKPMIVVANSEGSPFNLDRFNILTSMTNSIYSMNSSCRAQFLPINESFVVGACRADFGNSRNLTLYNTRGTKKGIFNNSLIGDFSIVGNDTIKLIVTVKDFTQVLHLLPTLEIISNSTYTKNGIILADNKQISLLNFDNQKNSIYKTDLNSTLTTPQLISNNVQFSPSDSEVIIGTGSYKSIMLYTGDFSKLNAEIIVFGYYDFSGIKKMEFGTQNTNWPLYLSISAILAFGGGYLVYRRRRHKK